MLIAVRKCLPDHFQQKVSLKFSTILNTQILVGALLILILTVRSGMRRQVLARGRVGNIYMHTTWN